MINLRAFLESYVLCSHDDLFLFSGGAKTMFDLFILGTVRFPVFVLKRSAKCLEEILNDER